jgi:nitrogen fixation protein NifZ
VICRVFERNQSKACASDEDGITSLCCQDFSETPPEQLSCLRQPGQSTQVAKATMMTNGTNDIPALRQLQPGDCIYARGEIRSDGSIPKVAVDALLAAPGTRGVIVNIGHLEEDPACELYLVRFEDAQLDLGPPVGCWPEELAASREECG